MAYIWTICPKYSEELVYGLHLVPSASTSWLHFSPNEMLAVNRVPIKSSGTIQCLERLALSSFPAGAVPGSCTHARMHAGWGQSCHFRGHCQISASTGWCGSAPYNHPDVSNQLGFSSPSHRLSAPSTPLNHCKHFMKVNEKIGLIEKPLLTFPMIIWIFSSPVRLMTSTISHFQKYMNTFFFLNNWFICFYYIFSL